MPDWNAEQYLKFEDERTRPARDLLAQIPIADARKVIDLGCGPGNSTELLVKRWQLKRLVGGLAPGGALAAQMPDNMDEPSHILMREVAHLEPWRKQLASAAQLRDVLPKPGVYYDALRPLCTRLESWHTVYNHVLDDAAAIVEWVKGTGLRPFVDPLDPPQRKAFLAEYTARVAASYLPQADGKVLLRFPRIFIVAVR